MHPRDPRSWRASRISSGRVLFIEDYDMAWRARWSRASTSGSTTRCYPLEASGTSGMKAAHQRRGELERARRLVGRGLRRPERLGDSVVDGRREPQARRRGRALVVRDAAGQVVPLYYERDATGLPQALDRAAPSAPWRRCLPRFNSRRMVARTTSTGLYRPAARARPSGSSADDCRPARALAAWKAAGAWPRGTGQRARSPRRGRSASGFGDRCGCGWRCNLNGLDARRRLRVELLLTRELPDARLRAARG